MLIWMVIENKGCHPLHKCLTGTFESYWFFFKTNYTPQRKKHRSVDKYQVSFPKLLNEFVGSVFETSTNCLLTLFSTQHEKVSISFIWDYYLLQTFFYPLSENLCVLLLLTKCNLIHFSPTNKWNYFKFAYFYNHFPQVLEQCFSNWIFLQHQRCLR